MLAVHFFMASAVLALFLFALVLFAVAAFAFFRVLRFFRFRSFFGFRRSGGVFSLYDRREDEESRNDRTEENRVSFCPETSIAGTGADTLV